MREAGLSYRAIAHRVGRNVATVLRSNAWYRAVERPIAMSSIYRRIRSFGIRSYRPHLVLPLTPNHR
ncbi:unnamed protein product, partial [Tenebrio molitor]